MDRAKDRLWQVAGGNANDLRVEGVKNSLPSDIRNGIADFLDARSSVGRLVFRTAMKNPDVSVKGIIEPFMNVDYMVYDSVHKRYPAPYAPRRMATSSLLS